MSGVHQTENCSELLTAAQTSGIHVDMAAKEFVVIDDGIATDRMDDWEDFFMYVEKMKDNNGEDEDNNDGTDDDEDDDLIILPEPVLTIRETYSIALSFTKAARR